MPGKATLAKRARAAGTDSMRAETTPAPGTVMSGTTGNPMKDSRTTVNRMREEAARAIVAIMPGVPVHGSSAHGNRKKPVIHEATISRLRCNSL